MSDKRQNNGASLSATGLSSATPIEPVPVSPVPASIPSAWPIDRYHAPIDLSERGAGFIEGYAAACEDLRRELTGDGCSGKSYDPMTVRLETGTMSSYAFDMKDGGRVHPLSDYATFRDVATTLLIETVEWIAEDCEQTAAILAGHAQAIEARRAETQGGSVHESAVGETDAPQPIPPHAKDAADV